MRILEIYDKEENKLNPATGTNAVFDKDNIPLELVLSKKISSREVDESSEIGSAPEMDSTTRSSMNAMIINVEKYNILSSDWKLNEETNLYEYDILDEGAKDKSIVSLYLDKENATIANDFEILQYTYTSEGNIKIFAKSLPISNIICDYSILTPLESSLGASSASNVATSLSIKMTEIEEILSKMIITKDNNVFDINDWVLDDTSKLYELTVNDSDVTADSLVNVQILTNFLSIAEDAGVSNYSESFDGGFKIFSTSKPVSNIEYNYVINNPYLR